jgi:hypothetical protein
MDPKYSKACNEYYAQQAQYGHGFPRYDYRQRGHGFFGDLGRFAFPLLKTLGKFILPHAVRAGKRVFAESVAPRRPFKTAVKENLKLAAREVGVEALEKAKRLLNRRQQGGNVTKRRKVSTRKSKKKATKKKSGKKRAAKKKVTKRKTSDIL